MEHYKILILLREYCWQNTWPRVPQWHHWIYVEATIARACVTKIGDRYLIDLPAFQKHVESASLVERGGHL